MRDVRLRLARGEDLVLPRLLPADTDLLTQRSRLPAFRQAASHRFRTGPSSCASNDPTLRFVQSGRDILRWLGARSIGPEGWPETLRELPPHCGYFVAELAQWCAERWRELADQIRADVDQAAT